MFLHKIASTYTPKIALVVYKKDDTQQESDGPKTYLEAYNFHPSENNQSYELGTGQPVSEDTLDSLTSTLVRRKKKAQKIYTFKSKMIPQNIIYAGQSENRFTIIWNLKAPVKTLHFSENLQIPSGDVQLPNLIFKLIQDGKQSQLSVYAYTATQLDDKTPLKLAPFHNTKENGVCMGTAKIKIKSCFWEDIIVATENAYFNSYFTHFWGGNPVDGNLNTIYHRCISEKKPFPLNVLIPSKKILKDIL